MIDGVVYVVDNVEAEDAARESSIGEGLCKGVHSVDVVDGVEAKAGFFVYNRDRSRKSINSRLTIFCAINYAIIAGVINCLNTLSKRP